RIGDAAAARQRNIFPRNFDRERLGLETGSVAHFARARRLVAAQLLAGPCGLGLEHPAVEVADHALEGLVDLVAALAVDEAQGNRAAAGAGEDHFMSLLRQV